MKYLDSRDDSDFIERLLREGKRIPEGTFIIGREISWPYNIVGAGPDKTKLVFGMGASITIGDRKRK